MQLKGMLARVLINLLMSVWMNVIMLVVLMMHSWANGRLNEDEVELIKGFFGLL